MSIITQGYGARTVIVKGYDGVILREIFRANSVLKIVIRKVSETLEEKELISSLVNSYSEESEILASQSFSTVLRILSWKIASSLISTSSFVISLVKKLGRNSSLVSYSNNTSSISKEILLVSSIVEEKEKESFISKESGKFSGLDLEEI